LTELLRATVDVQALRSNLRVLRERASRARVMAVVKANAYGHGLLGVARALPEADAFAVARIEEAVALRQAGIRQSVVLLEGVFRAEQLEAARQHDLELVVHQHAQLLLLEQAARRGASAAFSGVLWLKVDTGMNRLGFRPEEFPAALARVRALAAPPREIRVLTHLACADEPESPMTARQLEIFGKLTHGSGLATSVVNSAGLLAGAGRPAGAGGRGDWVRPGLALYGVSPIPGVTAASLGLRPAMQFETTVIAVRQVPAGESVGYGATWVAARSTSVAILAAGYGDGVPWGVGPATPRAQVLIGGRPAPLVGRVSMDMVAVDVGARSDIQPGVSALLWGNGLPVEHLAMAAGTIPYTLLCGVSLRVPRDYLGAPREPFP
jgi:alanine racemase